MPKPRKVQVSLETTPCYHCISLCGRRAFQCGVDALSGKGYEYRREWIVARIKELVEIFAIDTCAYSVLSNHYHIIVHDDTERVTGRSEQGYHFQKYIGGLTIFGAVLPDFAKSLSPSLIPSF